MTKNWTEMSILLQIRHFSASATETSIMTGILLKYPSENGKILSNLEDNDLLAKIIYK